MDEQEQEKKRIRSEVSDFIFSLRSSFRETQKQFAERLGVSAGMVAFYESGKNVPPLEVFVKLVKLAGVVPYKVFGIEAPVQYYIVEPKNGIIKIPDKNN